MQRGDLLAGRFLLEDKGREGPLGPTFRAVDQGSRAAVVVELFEASKTSISRFSRDARGWLELEHPAVVRPVAHGSYADGLYVVSPRLEGETLERRLERGPLALEEALGVVRDVAGALRVGHGRKLLHRGLRPENVWLTHAGQAALVASGACGMDTVGSGLRARGALQVPGYLAPEQAQAERDVGPQIDVFALGCLLIECLAGRPAFQGSHALATLVKLAVGQPPGLDALPEASPALVSLLASMLAKNPRQRLADGAAVERALGALTVEPPRERVFGLAEQRMVGLLLLGGRWTGDAAQASGNADRVFKKLKAAGLSPVRLLGDAVVAATTLAEPLLGQLARLAEVASELHASLPRAPLALGAARGEVADDGLGRVPEGDLIDRALGLLRAGAERAAGAAELPVRLDGLTAALLLDRFEVSLDEGGHVLGPTRSGPRSLRPAAPAPGGNDTWTGDAALAREQARIDALPPQQRRVLRAASVFGQACWRSGVEAILGASPAWPALLDAGLLRPRLPSRVPGDTELEFADEHLRSAFYHAIPEADRLLAHRRAARWLEQAKGPGAEIAEHLEQALAWPDLVAFCERAAREAMARGDHEEAGAWLDRGEAAGGDGLAALMLLRAEMQGWLGQRLLARKSALRALEGLPKEGPLYAQALGEAIAHCGIVGDTRRLTSAIARLEGLPCLSEDAAALAAAHAAAAMAALRVGKLEPAETLLRKAGELGELAPAPALRGQILRARALRAQLAGYPAACLKLRRAALACFQEAADPRNECLEVCNLAAALLAVGLNDDAEATAHASLATARALGLLEVEACSKVTLGGALLRRTVLGEARATLREAAAFFSGRSGKFFEGTARCVLASVLLSAGDPAAARREVSRSLTVLEPFPAVQVRALATLAQIELADSKPDDAIVAIERARSVAEAIGGQSDALLRLIRAQTHLVLDERAEAQRLLTEAERHLLSQAESFDAPRLREAFLRGVPEHARTLELAGLWRAIS